MKQEMEDELIGQMAADAALLQALTAVLAATSPQLQRAIERKVEAAALLGKQQLTLAQRPAFDARFADLRSLWD